MEINGQPSGLQLASRTRSFVDAWVLVTERDFEFPSDQSPVEALLEEALASDETLIIRKGKLTVVKISAAEIESQPKR